MRRVLTLALPPLVPLVLVLAAMELAVRMGWVRSFLVPPPSRVWDTLAAGEPRERAELWLAAWQTTQAAAAGFGLSAAGGIVIGVLLASARWVQRAFYPYAVFFQTVPIIAIAPLLVIWVGYGLPTVITSALIVSIFPVIANTLTGMLSVDPPLRDMFRLYGAGWLATLFKLRLPSALPSIFTGLRIAAGLAVVGAIVGEFITGGGIGGVIEFAKSQQRVDKIFAALILSAVIGISMFVLVNLASRLALRHWHASESGR